MGILTELSKADKFSHIFQHACSLPILKKISATLSSEMI